MKVALVHDWLTGMRGGEKCLEQACRLYPDARLFTLLHRIGATSPDIEQMQITTSLLQRLPKISKYYRYCLPFMPYAVERMQVADDVDLVLSFSHAVAKGITVPPGVPHVSYCFTPMRYAWQLRDHYFSPTDASRGSVARRIVGRIRDRALDRIREWDRESSSRVSHFVAISNTIAQRIHDCYGRESVVIYPPVDTEFFHPAFLQREDFFLCVSALTPYKRIDLAAEACERLGRRLIIIGDGPESSRLRQKRFRFVDFLGCRSNEEIRDHMRRCQALLFPGLEDFGIVPVEAQACATPVIAFGQGGATETVVPGGPNAVGTGLFFQEQDVDACCDAILKFEQHPQWFSPALCRRNAERFNSRRFETELKTYVENVASEGGADDGYRKQHELARRIA